MKNYGFETSKRIIMLINVQLRTKKINNQFSIPYKRLLGKLISVNPPMAVFANLLSFFCKHTPISTPL
jgi:hypothetical protein